MARTDPRPTYGSGVIVRGGYRYLWLPDHPLAHADGYVAEHRKVVYDQGIDIPPGSHVHHRNHIKVDNRPDNLEVLTHSEHMRQHRLAGAPVINQHGHFHVLDEAGRRAAQKVRDDRRHARDREARLAGGLCDRVRTGRRPCGRALGHQGKCLAPAS